MPQVEIDKDLAATMTPEELEAINAEASPEELEVMRQHKASQSDDDGDDDEDEDIPSADAQVVAIADDSAAPVTEEVSADPAPVQVSSDTKFKSALPMDFQQRVETVQSESSALSQKYRDGEIDFDAYTAQMAEVQARRDALNEERIKASVLDEINQQTTAKETNRAVNAFFDQASKSDKVDYRKDDALREDLIGFVERLEQRPEFAGKPISDLMAEAHKRVMAMHGKVTAPTPQADPIKVAKDARKPPVDSIPRTLAQVPGGDGPGDVADEFGSLDALDGLELETALAKLSPSQRDRYLRAA